MSSRAERLREMAAELQDMYVEHGEAGLATTASDLRTMADEIDSEEVRA